MSFHYAKYIAGGWILAVFLQSVGNRIGLVEPNFFLICANLLLQRVRHLSFAYVYALFGFTFDAFSSSLFGLHALSFFAVCFPAHYLCRLLERDQWAHLFVYGFSVGLLQAILDLGFMTIFEGHSFWLFFAKNLFFTGLLPEAALTAVLGILFFRLEKKF